MDNPDVRVFTIDFYSSAFVEHAPENYLTRITGRIHEERDDGSPDRLAGDLSPFYADFESALEEGDNPYDVLDLDGETEPFLALLDRRTLYFKESVSRTAGDFIYGRLGFRKVQGTDLMVRIPKFEEVRLEEIYSWG